MPVEPERRDFVRVAVDIPVRYRFRMPGRSDPEFERPLSGSTANLSGGGLLLQGRLPGISAVTDLLTGKALVDVELSLPGEQYIIAARGRCSWIETIDEGSLRCHLGVRFSDITPEDKERIFRYVIRVQMPV